MKKEIQKLINQYKILPAFMQKRSLYKIRTKVFIELSKTKNYIEEQKEKNEFMQHLFKASKPSVRLEDLTTFTSYYDYTQSETLIDILNEKEQNELLVKLDTDNLLTFWKGIKSEETKKQILPKILNSISNSKYPNLQMDRFSYVISKDTKKEAITLYANEIYELFQKYNYTEHQKEYELAYSHKFNRSNVVSNVMATIWEHLSLEQKNEIAPAIIDEFSTCEHYYLAEKSFNDFLQDFSPSIQKTYFNQIFKNVKKNITETKYQTDILGYMWSKIHPEVQALKFDEMKDFIQSIPNVSLKEFWANTSATVQRQKYYSILTENLKKTNNYEYWDLYEKTKGKLQSEILNQYLTNSLYSSPDNPDNDLIKALQKTSKEVFEKNFQYLFGKAKVNIPYTQCLLKNIPDEIKQQYSSAIGKYFSSNLEEYLKSPYTYILLEAGEYLNKESSEILMKNLIDFSKKNPDFVKADGTQIDFKQAITNFFTNISTISQAEIIENTLNETNLPLFEKLFNATSIESNEQKIEYLKKYFSLKGLSENDINTKIDLYTKLCSKNIELSKTIDLNFLESNTVNKLSEEQLLRITHYIDAQKHLINHENNKGFIKMFGILTTTPENWTIIADKIFSNLNDNNNHYNLLLENIKDKDLTEEEAKNLIEILSTNNYFELSTYEDIRDFNKPEGRKNQIIMQIFKGNYENLPLNIPNYSPNFLKKFALSEYLCNMSPFEIEHILHNYYKGIQTLSETQSSTEFKHVKKYLEICNLIHSANTTELDSLISYVLNDKNNITKYKIMDIESKIINVFGKSIEDSLYKPEEHLDEFDFNDTYDDNGEIKTVNVYRLKKDFNSLVRIEGAYSNFTPPEDFKKYFEVPNIEYHGNCESIIGNDLIAPAREKNNSIAVGYSRVYKNSLLLLGTDDLASNAANCSLAPINHQNNCEFYGVEENKNKTRHTHNETVMERLIVMPDGNVDKLKPSYIIWFEEEITEKCPPPEDNEKSEKWLLAKQAAAQMNLPIVVINREYYAQKETLKMHELENIVQGIKPLPENTTLPEIMEKLILTMENNSNSLRFSNKINMKYFTTADRERINNSIIEKINELSKTSPELAYECLQKIMPRYEYEKNASEAQNIRMFYEEKTSEMAELQEKLEIFLDKDTGIQTKISDEHKVMFENSIKTIANTEYYKSQKQHSIEHIEKVMLFSQILAQNEGLPKDDIKILLAAAAFHDSSRNGNEYNIEHAEEGAKTAGEYFSNPNNDFKIKPEEIPLIQVAIEYHEFNEKTHGTLDIEQIKKLCNKYDVPNSDFERAIKLSELLKDADALDRTRFAQNGSLDTRYLRSETAKSNHMILFAQKINDEYAKRVIDRNYHTSTLPGKNVAILRNQRINNKHFNEQQLTTTEMLDLFTEFAQNKGNHIPIEEKLDILFKNYSENHITVSNIQTAGNMLEEDRKKLIHSTYKEKSNSEYEDIFRTGDETK